ncbi:MAG: protein-glutamate O-methyltransferase [Desulfobacterales bacterium]|nr:protein-glutamate O-methyltransferase [Desulfobacterales bacterium]MDJ0854933.1 protein-glutamate O-methyltransferase [Desulfobacterales bacterium]MDJ0988442.1 protein-glutamate O-methyltransferase [Desulfobacterales bacterium]
MSLISAELNHRQFDAISQLIYTKCGISLKKGKEALVRARLMKRLRALKLKTIDDYMAFLDSEQGDHEIGTLIDVMTTNKTSFFREAAHFDFLTDRVIPEIRSPKIRIWSAACSSGEEPYTLAMVLRESIPQIDRTDLLILATDISNEMLATARRGVYSQERAADVPRALRPKYFQRSRRWGPNQVQVSNDLKKLVRFGALNLMHPWPMRGSFNAIFCRNVMIYFDRPTQQTLVNRFWDLLESGGYLFVGHSEGLSGIKHRFQYTQPAVYKKK